MKYTPTWEIENKKVLYKKLLKKGKKLNKKDEKTAIQK